MEPRITPQEIEYMKKRDDFFKRAVRVKKATPELAKEFQELRRMHRELCKRG